MDKILEVGEYLLKEGTTLERTGKFVSVRPLIKYINKPRCHDCKYFSHGRATKCGFTTTVCSLQKKNVMDKEGQVLYYHIGSRQIACDKFKYNDNQKYIAKDMKLTYKDILDKELKLLDNTLFDLDGVAVQGATHYLTVEDVKDIAKHFYELGLAQKGE